mgnify:CR=1 FL=1
MERTRGLYSRAHHAFFLPFIPFRSSPTATPQRSRYLAIATFDRKFAPEATLHTVLCAIHHESGTKLLAAKKYHFIEPGPPMMARCKADTPLTSTFASLGLTGRVALNLGESEA